jgi:catechol 2,3-dioxygenase-like lactoylglutathione lyase family enzyme
MLRPKGLNHVALTVSDMDRSLRFYQDLGLELLRTSGPDAEGVRSAVIRVGDQEINVFQQPGLVSMERDNATGMHHFCLDMDADSMGTLMAELGQAGVSVVRGPVARRDGSSVFVRDPDGVRVELRLAK